jgi:hypothetical protein
MRKPEEEVIIRFALICENCYEARDLHRGKPVDSIHPSQWQRQVCGFCGEYKELCRVMLLEPVRCL